VHTCNTSTWEAEAGGLRVQAFTPIILATQEAEIRRIVVQSQPKANSSQDPISKTPNPKKGWHSGSSDRVQGPEFKPQSCKKQTNKQNQASSEDIFSARTDLLNIFLRSLRSDREGF
jgi:hypothetical protein